MRISFFLAFLFCFVNGWSQLKRYSFTENKMGSPFTIIIYCTDSVNAKEIVDRCFYQVDSLVNIFSDYLDSSELNRLCATAGTNTAFKCSPALIEILQLSKNAYEKSEHTFDITLGPLTKMWRSARKEKKFPDSVLVKEKRKLTGPDKILIDLKNSTVTLLMKGMQLDLGGIAQGYIAQKTIDLLKKNKIKNALVNVSGDIVCIGSPPDKKGWIVGVNIPEKENEMLPRHLTLTNYAVTTSGDVYQFMEHDGKRYSHVIDPSTGYGITSQRNVTVIAYDGTLADWLTKACSILSIEKSKRLATRLNAALLIVESKNGKLIFHSSKNFKHFWNSSNSK